jgi:hypothetical protein
VGEAVSSGGGGGGSGEQQQQQVAAPSWDAPPMRVRFYDWQASVDALPPGDRAALAAARGVPASAADSQPGGSIDVGSNEAGAPGLGADESFDVVIGTDVLYEWWVCGTGRQEVLRAGAGEGEGVWGVALWAATAHL